MKYKFKPMITCHAGSTMVTVRTGELLTLEQAKDMARDLYAEQFDPVMLIRISTHAGHKLWEFVNGEETEFEIEIKTKKNDGKI